MITHLREVDQRRQVFQTVVVVDAGLADLDKVEDVGVAVVAEASAHVVLEVLEVADDLLVEDVARLVEVDEEAAALLQDHKIKNLLILIF